MPALREQSESFRICCYADVSENRKEIPEKFRKKIEAIVRKKRGTLEDVVPDSTPSPYDTKIRVPVNELVCPTTRNDIPWCIISGYVWFFFFMKASINIIAYTNKHIMKSHCRTAITCAKTIGVFAQTRICLRYTPNTCNGSK